MVWNRPRSIIVTWFFTWFNLEKLKMDAFTALMLLFFVLSVVAAYQLNMFLLLEAELTYGRERLRMYLEYLNSPGLIVSRCRVHKPRGPRRFWVKPGRTRSWWDSFVSNIVPPEDHSHWSWDYQSIFLCTVKQYTRKAIFIIVFLNSILV